MENNRKDILPKDYEFNLSDFALFLSVMKNKEAYQCVLSIIMDEASLELSEVKVEQVILNKKGLRAIRLDAWAVDRKNRQFNIEMQNDTKSDDILFLSHKRISLGEIWQNTHLWRGVWKYLNYVWKMEHRKYF